jgi:sulfite exporter TauE/SafE
MLWSAVLLGLLGSFHCLGMCGPIAFMLPVNRQNSVTKVFQTGAYHFGRLAAYVLMGVFFGWIGKGLYIFGMQQNLSIAIGVIMIIVALTPTRTLNRLYISRPLYRVIGNDHRIFKRISPLRTGLYGAFCSNRHW